MEVLQGSAGSPWRPSTRPVVMEARGQMRAHSGSVTHTDTRHPREVVPTADGHCAPRSGTAQGSLRVPTAPPPSLTRAWETRDAPGRAGLAPSRPRRPLLLQLAAVGAEAHHHAAVRRARHAGLLEALAAHGAHGRRRCGEERRAEAARGPWARHTVARRSRLGSSGSWRSDGDPRDGRAVAWRARDGPGLQGSLSGQDSRQSGTWGVPACALGPRTASLWDEAPGLTSQPGGHAPGGCHPHPRQYGGPSRPKPRPVGHSEAPRASILGPTTFRGGKAFLWSRLSFSCFNSSLLPLPKEEANLPVMERHPHCGVGRDGGSLVFFSKRVIHFSFFFF